MQTKLKNLCCPRSLRYTGSNKVPMCVNFALIGIIVVQQLFPTTARNVFLFKSEVFVEKVDRGSVLQNSCGSGKNLMFEYIEIFFCQTPSGQFCLFSLFFLQWIRTLDLSIIGCEPETPPLNYFRSSMVFFGQSKKLKPKLGGSVCTMVSCTRPDRGSNPSIGYFYRPFKYSDKTVERTKIIS